jgi:hypothetical protein
MSISLSPFSISNPPSPKTPKSNRKAAATATLFRLLRDYTLILIPPPEKHKLSNVSFFTKSRIFFNPSGIPEFYQTVISWHTCKKSLFSHFSIKKAARSRDESGHERLIIPGKIRFYFSVFVLLRPF